MTRSLFATVAALALTGCYAHVPAQPGELEPGSAVRVRVSPTQLERLEAQSPIRERVFRAEVVEADRAEILLQVRVPGAQRVEGRLYNRVALAPEDMLELEIRRLDRPKTFAAIGAAAVAVGAAAWVAFEETGDPDFRPKEPGEPTQISVPLQRLLGLIR